jgi:hypothetical protein
MPAPKQFDTSGFVRCVASRYNHLRVSQALALSILSALGSERTMSDAVLLTSMVLCRGGNAIGTLLAL